jgi:hypothetical protein
MTRRALRGRVVGRFFLRPRLTGLIGPFCHVPGGLQQGARIDVAVTLSDGRSQHAALTFCWRTY